MASELCFTKRNTAKFDAPDFLAVFCLESQKGSPSYNDLAARIEAIYGISTSKQALCKRINQSCVLFFQAVLAKAIKIRIEDEEITGHIDYGKYKRILIQDSTIIKLPLKLFDVFSGVSNSNTAVCNARIQGVYDLVSGRFIEFSIDSYSKNDLLAAPELEIISGDLVLRDRGYLTIDELSRHLKIGADCIYRHKSHSIYLDANTDEPINLLALLKKRKKVDLIVCLNNKERTKVRLLAQSVKKEIADKRRMKAKKEMKGHNPSKEILEFLGYTIFITTITDGQTGFVRILSIYRIRWKIEIIFKIWKSNMHFSKIHNVSYFQLITLLTARLIMIVLVMHRMYVFYQKQTSILFNKELSMMKFVNYLVKNYEKIYELINGIMGDKKSLYQICLPLARYCAYDTRKRLNINTLAKVAFLS